MKFLLQTTVIRNGEKLLRGSTIDIELDEVSEMVKYGTLLEPIPVQPVTDTVSDASEGDLRSEKISDDKISTQTAKKPVKRNTRAKKA